jgi:hypothetical protein
MVSIPRKNRRHLPRCRSFDHRDEEEALARVKEPFAQIGVLRVLPPQLGYGENAMKALFSMLALAVALAVTGPAFAGDVTAAKTQADCEKAGGTWDAATSKCAEKKM